MRSINNFNVPDFDVAGIFGKLANEDFENQSSWRVALNDKHAEPMPRLRLPDLFWQRRRTERLRVV